MPYKDPDVAKAKQKERYAKDPSKWKNPDGSWRKITKASVAQRRERYNTDAEYRQKHQAAGRARSAAKRVFGVCPICLIRPPAYGKIAEGQLVKDHCHKTDVVRGYICSNCNLALGHAMDSPENLERMAAYLRQALKTTDMEAK